MPLPIADPRSVWSQPLRYEERFDPRALRYTELYGRPLSVEDEGLAAAVQQLKTPQVGPAAYEGLEALPGSARADAVKRAMRAETLTNLGLAGGLGALQFAAQAVPTAYDVYSEERRKEVERRLGRLPTAVEEQFTLAGAGLKQASAERARGAEAMQAGMGRTSAAAALAPGREAARQDIQAAVSLGAEKAKATASNLEAQLQEIEERTARKGARQAAMLGTAAQAIGGLAPIIAQGRAGRLMQQLDLSTLASIQDPVERAFVFEQVQKAGSPAAAQALIELYGGATGGAAP